MPIYSDRAGISLFDALTSNESGELVFPADTITEVSSALAKFSRIALLHNVPRSNILVFATEAMRRASNARDMLEAISEKSGGLNVRILHPSVETLFGAVMGSRSGLTDVSGGALFLDLGGGSVQMTWVDTDLDCYEIKAARAGISLPFGAAKLIKVLGNEDQKSVKTELDSLQSGLKSAFDKLVKTFSRLSKIQASYEKGGGALLDVYMCGGGFRGYGSMLMHSDRIQPYPISSIGSYTVTGSAFKQVDKMCHVNDTYDAKIFGMSNRRRQQFPAIAAIINNLVEVVPNIGHVTFCKGSNRDGALMMKLPRNIRESNPLEVLADVDDSERPLFDAVLRKLTQAIPAEVEFKHSKAAISGGLGQLFVRDMWTRAGHEAETNASFALHHSITRDSDVPGLTHQARAALAIALVARWGNKLGPSDLQLLEGLQGISKRHGDEVSFWAEYVGTIANVLCKLFPHRPDNIQHFEQAIIIEANLKHRKDKKDRVELTILVASESAQGINLKELSSMLEKIGKGQGKPPKKVNARVSLFTT